jgi:hypothetical protein
MGLRKIWVAQDMEDKNRTSFKPEDMVYTPIPELALAGKPDLLGGVAEIKSFAPVAASASAAPADSADASGSKSGSCSVETRRASSEGLALFVAVAVGVFARRRPRA